MILLLKLVLAPLLVVGSSVAGRRWGNRVAGTLVAFPIVAGPILLISCWEHGARFGARAATASLLGLVSLAVFAVVFAHAGRRRRWPTALALAWAASLLADVALVPLSVGPGVGALLVLVSIRVAYRLIAAIDDGPTERTVPAPPWWDLPGRALATGSLVLLVTGIAAQVGPVVTGILAPFPIATSVVAAFVLARQGPAAMVRTLAGVIRGLVGFAAFCLVLAVLLVPVGVPGAFGAAVAAVLVVQVGGAGWAGRRHRAHPVRSGMPPTGGAR
ncbi:hypothetical protein [Actinoplanes xinjiangensis]|uniref:hypothetical protein n=1 Tax=Actinoplanes xinjiangensis TaxID=512350 RepID=UPI0034486796